MALVIRTGWDKYGVVRKVVGLEQCWWSMSKSWFSAVNWEALTGPG